MRKAAARTGRRRSRWFVGLAAGAVVVLVLAVAWGSGLRRPQRASGGQDLGRLPSGVARNQLNLLVVTLDTTRADRVGAYSADQAKTPVFDRLAREGVLFEQTEAVAPLTLPAHVSIFTGRFPPEHGVRDNGGFFVSPKETTLATILKGAGFQTGAVVGAYVLDGKWGLNKAFDTYVDDFDTAKVRGLGGAVQRPANEVVDRALPWLEKVKGQRFFAWLHFYDAHTPYDPPEPYRTEYAGRPYNGEIAFVDSQLGRVIAFLEREGLLDRTVIAVVGDHGESLDEHGEASHGFFIYESTTRVPFVIRAPFDGLAGRRVADPVRAVDLLPSVLDLLGVAAPAGIPGASLAPLMAGTTREMGLETYSESMYPLHHFGWSDVRTMRVGRFKVFDAPRPELYDLERDPREEHNLVGERRALANQMLDRLRARQQTFSAAGPSSQPATDVDPEVRARLAALGYVGSFVATTASPHADRADPKDKIHLFNLMNAARETGKEGENSLDKAVPLLRQVTDADPNVIDAWFMLGNEYFKARKFGDALNYFKKALALKPDYDLALINMANSYRALGNDEAAMAGYEQYLRIDPKNAYVRYQTGEILLDRGDRAAAEQRFREALAIDPKVAPARVALGVLAFERGDFPAAERELTAALQMKPDVRLAHFNLALIAEAREDWKTAENEYKLELQVRPDAFKAAFNLGLLYERLGNQDAQVAALKQSIEANDAFAEGYFYLAKAWLNANDLDQAAAMARKGLAVGPESTVAPLGHYVLAGVLTKRGRMAEAERELAAGRALEARTTRTKKPLGP
jgi:arylsulfatase A-like enzyme/Tfp pilus assembly protein PilF